MVFNAASQQSEDKVDPDIRRGAARGSGEWKINEENPKVITPFTWTVGIHSVIIHLSEVIMAPGRNAFTHRGGLNPTPVHQPV